MEITVFVVSKESYRFSDLQGIMEHFFNSEELALEYLSKVENYYSYNIKDAVIEKYDDGFEIYSNSKWSYEFKIFKRIINIHEDANVDIM